MCEYAAQWKLRSVSGGGSRVETVQAWRLLVLFIVNKVKSGFDNEMRAVQALVDRDVNLFPAAGSNSAAQRKHSANPIFYQGPPGAARSGASLTLQVPSVDR